MRTRTLALCGIAGLVLSGFNTRVVAQGGAQAPPAPPVRMLVTTTVIKSGSGVEYRSVIEKEGVPAFKKAGIPWRWVFQSGPLSGAGNTYIAVQPVTSLAQFDDPPAIQRALGQDGAAKYNAKLQPLIVGTHSILQTLIAAASLQSFPSTPPPLVHVQTIDLIAGKGGDFSNLIVQEYLPALKKAGVTDYLVFAATYGGPGSRRSIVQYLSKYADLDQQNPIARAIGQEGAQKLNLKRTALTQQAESAVYRLVPALSYGAPARPQS